MSQPQQIQFVIQPETRVEKVKQYFRDNSVPITYGAMIGVTFMAVFVVGERFNKDLLVLKHKRLKQLSKAPSADGSIAGVEYNIRGNRLWLIPAMLPVDETPYV